MTPSAPTDYRLILHYFIKVVVLTAISHSSDRRFELLVILGYNFIMRRLRDRNRLGSIVAVLSALSAFQLVHQIQAEKASWISPTASSHRPLKLASYKEIGKNRASTINSVDRSGKECGMHPEEFAKSYPPLVAWIRNTLTASAPVAQARASPPFKQPFRACADIGLSSMCPVAICTTWTALRNYAFPQVELSNV